MVRHRRRLQLTQEDLAARSGVSVRSIQHLESGRANRPRQATIRALVRGLDLDRVAVDEFLRGAGLMPATPTAGEEPVVDAGGADARGLGTRDDAPEADGRDASGEDRDAIRPAQLPLGAFGFVGREAELAQLDALVAQGGGSGAGTVVICVVSGTAGVGKTALAVHWSHRVADRFPDGQLYVNLRGFDPGGSAVAVSEVLRGFLEALGVSAERAPAGVDARVGLYRSLLVGRRVLVVLDNARDAEQVRPLLPGSPGCMVMVTSRNRLSGLVAADGARPLVLDLLSRRQARGLLSARLGAARVAAEPAAVDEIVRLCARLPLALAIVAARAAMNPGFSLAVLAEELRGARGGLDVFSGGDAASDVRSVFSWSYRALRAEPARVFRLLGLFAGFEASVPAVASLAAVTVRDARRLLGELVNAHLLAEHRPGRYVCHDLLRAYARELAEQHDPEGERDLALRRMLDHYLHSAYAAASLTTRYHHLASLRLDPPCDGVSPQVLAGHQEAARWLTAEQSMLVACVRYARNAGLYRHAWQLAATMVGFLNARARWVDQIAMQRLALEAGQRLGDLAVQGFARFNLGRAESKLEHFEAADEHLQLGLRLFGELGDCVGQALCYFGLTDAAVCRGEPRLGVRYAEQSVQLARRGGNDFVHGMVLNALGWSHMQCGDHRQALAPCLESLELHERLGDRNGQAAALDSLGVIYHKLGEYRAALDRYRRAAELFGQTGDPLGMAQLLDHRGDSWLELADVPAAVADWRRALELLEGLDAPGAAEVRAKLAQHLASGDGQTLSTRV